MKQIHASRHNRRGSITYYTSTAQVAPRKIQITVVYYFIDISIST